MRFNKLFYFAGCLLPIMTPVSAEELTWDRIEIYPPQVDIRSQRDSAQLVVTGHVNGESYDLTHLATCDSTNQNIVSVKSGLVTPESNGQAKIVAAYGGVSDSVDVDVSNHDVPDPVRFRHETLAILTKQGCNAGSCHGSPQGKGGFSLSLFAFDPDLDYHALTRIGLSRRINVLEPAQSLMLKKPLLRLPHVGGKRLQAGEIPFRILRSWIQEGAKHDLQLPDCTGIELFPNDRLVLARPYQSQQISVIARFADGTSRDVTRIATYDTSHKQVASVGPGGQIVGHEKGFAAITVRFLEHLESIYVTSVENKPDFQWNEQHRHNVIDELVHSRLKLLQIQPSPRCDDSVFLRRLYLDLTGLLPNAEVVRRFLEDKAADKRTRMIDRLLQRPEFARFQSLRMADLMRINSDVLKDGRAEFFGKWLVDSLSRNMPYNQLVREILTASGDTKTVAPANYFAALASTESITESTAQVFMGARIQCAKCHNHPFENWTQNDYFRMGAVFHRIKNQDGVIKIATEGEMLHPKSGKAMQPWGHPIQNKSTDSADQTDRRVGFVNWLTDEGNSYFAQVAVNRIWSHLFGKGIVDPVDDFRSSNPPSNIELLRRLASEFRQSGYDQKHIFRFICNSQTYQQSAESNASNQDDQRLFSRARLRLLTAEQLHDAIGIVTGTLTSPKNGRAVDDMARFATQRVVPEQTGFLKAFGQPQRETPCACERSGDPTLDQALQLLNGKHVQSMLHEATKTYRNLSVSQLIERVFLTAFCRFPTQAELATANRHFDSIEDQNEATRNLVWAIVNTQEFMFQH